MRLYLSIFFIVSFLASQAQILKPAKWSFETSKKEVKVGEQIDVIFYATIDKDWYVYSSDFDSRLVPQVTTVTSKPNDTYQLVGKVKAVHPKNKYSDLFESEYTYFVGKAEFHQAIKI